MRLIDADKLKIDCITNKGTVAVSQSQLANAPTYDLNEIRNNTIDEIYEPGWIRSGGTKMINLEPKINWIPFDKDNPPIDLNMDGASYLIFLREDDYDDGATWTYSVDVATPYGGYLDDFWDTEYDWKEGQRVEVLAYAELPYMQHEEELVRSDIDKRYFTKHETKECPCCNGTGMSTPFTPENKCGYCDGKGVIEND